jgi:hypothetical protein
MKRRSIAVLVASSLVAGLAAAQAPSTPPLPPASPTNILDGYVSIGWQGDSSSGDVSRFRELTEGERSGAFLDALQLRSIGANPWTLDAAYSTGNRGRADFRMTTGAWRGRATVVQVTSWSALSFADEVLASGASIRALYPGTTALDPLFDTDEPNVDLIWSEASIERDFGPGLTLALRGGHRARDGSRVPNIGGFSFSDLGTPAFFAPGLESIDSASSFGAVEARMSRGAFSLRAEAGARTRENKASFLLPAYGESALLDLNQWEQRANADEQWARVDGAYGAGSLTIHGAASWTDVANDPSGRDLRVRPGGEIVRGGLGLAHGSIDASSTRGALGATLRLGARSTLTLAADAGTGSSEGSGDLLLRAVSLGEATSARDREMVGAIADFAGRFGAARVRVRGRVSTTSTDLLETGPADYVEDLTRERDRTEIRADVSRSIRRGVRLRGWGLWRADQTSVELRELTSGFTHGGGEREEASAGIELSLGSAVRRILLSARTTAGDFENEPPLFDPVFDPSVELQTTTGSMSSTRISASVVRAFTRSSVWGELGWLTTEYDFDDLVTHPGFRAVQESVEGIVALAGGEFSPREGARLTGRLEWIRDQEDLDRTLTRGSLELAQAVRTGVELFGRWSAGEYDSSLSGFDGHSVNLFALGVRTTF